ncbi:MAG: MBL fold metallo-hydrolase [Chitinophagales bacterium]|nr:MBL fold metallo-hydrolase [Chitinophagales bacterium]MDW8419526.1 MBL fold metallo-hydrolase [Chitinophagales bacterium]
MLRVFRHIFNPFQENTYIVADTTGECIIIDAGCSNSRECSELSKTITGNALKPVRLLNTHCHIDHFPGNKYVHDTYGLLPEFHPIELEVMRHALVYRDFFGFHCEASPEPKNFLNEGDVVTFGNTTLQVLFTPGHSPGSLSFYSAEHRMVFSGDVLFLGSVGRFDLPGADGETLYSTIQEKLMTLPDDTTVYSGHGPETTIGHERRTNPFMNRAYFFG